MYTSGQEIFIFLSIVNPAIYTVLQLKRNFWFCVTQWRTQLTLQSMTLYTGEMKVILLYSVM